MKNKIKAKTKILVFIFKFYYGTSTPPYTCNDKDPHQMDRQIKTLIAEKKPL